MTIEEKDRALSYWHPQVMCHRRPEDRVEYAIHEVYFDDAGRAVTYTADALSARLPSPAELKTWILENVPAAERGIVCGDLGYTYDRFELESWLRYVDEPPLEYPPD